MILPVIICPNFVRTGAKFVSANRIEYNVCDQWKAKQKIDIVRTIKFESKVTLVKFLLGKDTFRTGERDVTVDSIKLTFDKYTRSILIVNEIK